MSWSQNQSPNDAGSINTLLRLGTLLLGFTLAFSPEERDYTGQMLTLVLCFGP